MMGDPGASRPPCTGSIRVGLGLGVRPSALDQPAITAGYAHQARGALCAQRLRGPFPAVFLCPTQDSKRAAHSTSTEPALYQARHWHTGSSLALCGHAALNFKFTMRKSAIPKPSGKMLAPLSVLLSVHRLSSSVARETD